MQNTPKLLLFARNKAIALYPILVRLVFLVAYSQPEVFAEFDPCFALEGVKKLGKYLLPTMFLAEAQVLISSTILFLYVASAQSRSDSFLRRLSVSYVFSAAFLLGSLAAAAPLPLNLLPEPKEGLSSDPSSSLGPELPKEMPQGVYQIVTIAITAVSCIAGVVSCMMAVDANRRICHNLGVFGIGKRLWRIVTSGSNRSENDEESQVPLSSMDNPPISQEEEHDSTDELGNPTPGSAEPDEFPHYSTVHRSNCDREHGDQNIRIAVSSPILGSPEASLANNDQSVQGSA